LQSKHEDNPSLYTAGGVITERGIATMETLDALTGVRYQRLRMGLWVQAEGIVYSEFDVNNLTDDDPDPTLPIELAIDEGYIDPRVILFIQRTPDRILVFDEIYHSKHLAQVCVAEAVARCGEWLGWKDHEKTIPQQLPEIAVGSPEAKEIQSRFKQADIPFRWPADKSIANGIDVMRGLICDGNGRRMIQVNRRCKNFLDEITEGYQYPATGSRKNDEIPVDANNHAMDAMRYWCQVRGRR
jgi:phage terminase large subunit